MGAPKRYRWRVIDAVESSDLPPIARHLMHVLCGRADLDTGELGEHSPSLSLLARLTGWKPTAIKAHLGVLEDGKWLIRNRPAVADARSAKERTHYIVRIPAEPPMPGLSRSCGDLDKEAACRPDEPARSPHDLALGRHTTRARSPHGHASDQSDRSDHEYTASAARAAGAAPGAAPIAFAYRSLAEDLIDELSADAYESGVITNMADKGANRKAIVNKVTHDRYGIPKCERVCGECRCKGHTWEDRECPPF